MLIVRSLIGAVAVAPFGQLVIDPHLPAWLPDLSLERVRVGSATVDLPFRRRRDGSTTYEVLGRTGRVRVIRLPPPQALGAHLPGRLVAALGSLRSL